MYIYIYIYSMCRPGPNGPWAQGPNGPPWDTMGRFLLGLMCQALLGPQGSGGLGPIGPPGT